MNIAYPLILFILLVVIKEISQTYIFCSDDEFCGEEYDSDDK